MSFNIMKTRAITSTLLIIDFFVVAFTGLGLTQAPSGELARQQGWTFFGFPKLKLERLHTISGLIMIAIVVFHFSLNYSMYINELKFTLKSLRKSKTTKK